MDVLLVRVMLRSGAQDSSSFVLLVHRLIIHDRASTVLTPNIIGIFGCSVCLRVLRRFWDYVLGDDRPVLAGILDNLTR